jgi:hypothetical protein
MATLTYPISADGLAVPVMIGLTAAETSSLFAAGGPLVSPSLGNGMIDTGSNVTCVDRSLLRGLGLSFVLQHTTQTVSGPLSVDLFDVNLSLPRISGGSGPLLVLPYLRIMELRQPIRNVQVLIGLDVLAHCVLTLDGPRQEFSLSV